MFRLYAKLILATVFWGATWSVGRALVQEVPPFAAAFIRFAIAVACMGLWLRHAEGRLPKVRGRDFAILLALGFTGIFLYNAFFLHGLQHIDAGRAALMVALNPVAITLVSTALGQDRLSSRKLLGLGLAMAGSVWVISRGDPASLWHDVGVGLGEGLILGCVVAWTFYTVLGRQATKTMSPLAVNVWACGLGCVLLGGAAAVEAQGAWAWPVYSFKAWASLVFLGVFGTALSYIWYTEGVKELGAAKAAVFINLVPLSGVLIATLALQEHLPIAVWVGGAVSLAGVAVTTLAGVSWSRSQPHGLGLSTHGDVTPSLRDDISRFDQDEGLKTLEVMAACMRHGERLTMQLQCGQHMVPLTVFPKERLAYSPLPMVALLSMPMHEMRVIHIEPSELHPPEGRESPWDQLYQPLTPLLWALALHGARDALLPEIAGRAAYRITSSIDLAPMRMSEMLSNAVDRLRLETTDLRSLAAWPGLNPQLASRLLNAIYLQSALMVTRSHPDSVSGSWLGPWSALRQRC